jgi:hypothetical protein
MLQGGPVAMEKKIEALRSCIVMLEERFNSRPSDVADQRRRDNLLRYDIAPLLYLGLTSF